MAIDTEAYKKSFFEWCDNVDASFIRRFPNSAPKAKEAGARPAFILLNAFAFALLFSLYKCGQSFTSQCVGFLYPAWASVHALRTEDPDDDTQWLTYWVAYAGFILCESVSDTFVSWFPLYYFLKTFFLVWMFHPRTLGAKIMFDKVINPGVTKIEYAWNKFFDEDKKAGLKEAAKDAASALAAETQKAKQTGPGKRSMDEVKSSS